jgi:hypothetical protein
MEPGDESTLAEVNAGGILQLRYAQQQKQSVHNIDAAAGSHSPGAAPERWLVRTLYLVTLIWAGKKQKAPPKGYPIFKNC